MAKKNKDGIRVMKWVDKRAVLMITTVPSHTADLKATGRKNRKNEEVFKPPAVIAYNKNKKGVDMSDQMAAYYTSLRKSIKCYKKVFFEIILGTCVVNSWIIYNEFGRNRKKIDMLQVREKNANELLKGEDENNDDIDNIEAEDNVPANEAQQPIRKRARTNVLA